MTNDQCEQVVEEIWGWGYKEHEHMEMVKSWQGFGRTVEAMIRHKGAKKFCDKLQINLAASLASAIYIDDLWEATHLAALEALRNE